MCIRDRYDTLDNLIVTGSSTIEDEMAFDSNYSLSDVDLFAPGENVYSLAIPSENGTGNNNLYRFGRGTSYAAPHVAAAAALIMSKATHYTPLQVKQLLMNTVDTSTAFSGKCVSGGRLNVNNAVDYLYAEQRPIYSVGDVTGDGYITIADYNAISDCIAHTISFNAQQTAAGDLDGSGSITTTDLLKLAGYINKLTYFAPSYNS